MATAPLCCSGQWDPSIYEIFQGVVNKSGEHEAA